MNLLGLVESPGHVCCRYRLEAFRGCWERAGHHLEFLSLPRRGWKFLTMIPSIRRADAVILQRKFLPPAQFYLLRRSARLVLFDFDDAVFLHDSYDPRGLHCETLLRRFASVTRDADAIIAGNDYLRQESCRFTFGDKVHVVPTCVDPERYPLAEHRRVGAGVELVWIGSSSTLQGMEAIGPLLETVGQSNPGLRLKVICDRFLQLRDLPVTACPWTEAGEASEVARADIGISWVPDDMWSRGKCGLKVLQYMAAGLPVVANPVGVQCDMVRHGETGFLASTVAEWVEAVRLLANDPELRRRLGRAGRRRVEQDFSVAVGASQWLDILHSLPSRTRAHGN